MYHSQWNGYSLRVKFGPGNLIFVTLSENTEVLTAKHATNGQTNKLALRWGRGSPCGRHRTVPHQSCPRA
jgi:hypothetical protein